MSGEGHWDPTRLGNLTLAQFQCLASKTPPGAAPVLGSMGEFEAALAALDEEESDWYA